MKMTKKLGAILCAAAMAVSVGSVAAYAASYNVAFTFSGPYESVQRMSLEAKEDGEPNFYVTLNDSYNWTPGVDRVYIWTEDILFKQLSDDNNYYVRYVKSDAVPYYTPAPGKGASTRLVGWHNNNGHEKSFSVWGLWTP